MLVDLKPAHQRPAPLPLARRQHDALLLVHTARARHLVEPRAHVRADEGKHALERRHEHARYVVRRVEPQLRAREQRLGRLRAVDEPRARRAAHDHVRDAVAVLRLVVRVVEHAPRRDGDARGRGHVVAGRC